MQQIILLFEKGIKSTNLLIAMLFLIMFLACGNYSKQANDNTTALSDSTNTHSIGCSPMDSLYKAGLPRTARLEDSNENFSIFLNNDKKAEYDEEAFTTSLFVFCKKDKRLSKLLTTTEPEGYGWHKPVGENAIIVTLADIHAIYRARLFPYANKLLICGCFDMRNDFSYIIDLDDKSVLCLPTNNGLVGFTLEEGYAIMQSYAYNTGLDENGEPKGGRHTVLSVFDDKGILIRSLDLENN